MPHNSDRGEGRGSSGEGVGVCKLLLVKEYSIGRQSCWIWNESKGVSGTCGRVMCRSGALAAMNEARDMPEGRRQCRSQAAGFPRLWHPASLYLLHPCSRRPLGPRHCVVGALLRERTLRGMSYSRSLACFFICSANVSRSVR